MKAHPVIVTADEAKAIIAGTLTQLRLPAWEWRAGTRRPSRYMGIRVSDLLWVQEPFIEFIGWRRGAGCYGMAYGTLGSGARAPEHMNGVERKVHHRRPERMRREQSRLTLEVTDARTVRDAAGDERVAITFRPRGQNIDAYLAGEPIPAPAPDPGAEARERLNAVLDSVGAP